MSDSQHSTPPLRSAMKHSASSTPELPASATLPDSPAAARFPAISRPSTASSLSSQLSTPYSVSSVYTTRTATPPPGVMSPVTGYTPKVSFDTFEDEAATLFSFTLGVKNEGYTRTRSTRVFLCAASPDESGREALDWALESLVQHGDELIVCRAIDLEDLCESRDVRSLYLLTSAKPRIMILFARTLASLCAKFRRSVQCMIANERCPEIRSLYCSNLTHMSP